MNKLHTVLLSVSLITGCAKYDIQKDYKELNNLEGIVINKTDNTNSDTLIYAVRIMTSEGTFDKYDKNLYDSTDIGQKVLTDLNRTYETLTLKKNKSNCNTKYLKINDEYTNIRKVNK